MIGRTYLLTSDEKAGWYLGLTPAQVITTVTGVALGVLFTLGGAGALTPVVLLAAGALALGRWKGEPVLHRLPPLVRTAALGSRRRTWMAPVDLLQTDAAPLPPCLAGQQLVSLQPTDWPELTRPVAVAFDGRAGTWAATVAVSGSDLALADADERDALVAGWGNALAGFSSSSAVRSVRWTEWAAPSGTDEHEAWLAEHLHGDEHDPIVTDYRGLLRTAGRIAARHEVLLTVVVDAGKVKPPPDTDRARAAVGELLTETRLLTDRLAAAGLTVSPPLGPSELARALRVRLDPGSMPVLDARGRTLGDLTGAVRAGNSGPLSSETSLRWWRADGTWHRGFYVAEWPQRPVTADWLAGVLLESTCTRTVAVWFKPVPSTVALAKVEHRAAQLDGDAQHRAEKGFRLSASFQAARRSVADREAELVAGHAEDRFAGVVTVSAPSPDQLERDARDLVALAARWGVELRALDGRHDQAVAATLPLPRGLR